MVGLCLAALSAEAQQMGRNQYFVRDGQLMRGKDKVELHTLGVPRLVNPDFTKGEFLTAVARLSDVGANAVCFDLPRRERRRLVDRA